MTPRWMVSIALLLAVVLGGGFGVGADNAAEGARKVVEMVILVLWLAGLTWWGWGVVEVSEKRRKEKEEAALKATQDHINKTWDRK